MSKAEARSREREAPADRTRRPVEEPDREASVQIINPEDEQGKKNGIPNQESSRSKPVEDPQAKDWLDSIQWLRVAREHQINQILQREAYGAFSEQDKLSLAREAEKFRAAEVGFRKFMERGRK